MKGPPRPRWLLSLLMALLLATFLPTDKAFCVDPKNICKEYGDRHPEMFEDLCSDPKEKWKVGDGDALLNYIKSGCMKNRDQYWDTKANTCEKRPKCRENQYWSEMTNKCREPLQCRENQYWSVIKEKCEDSLVGGWG